MTNFNDLVGFGVFMSSLWSMMPLIVRDMIVAVASLSIVLGITKLID